MVSPQKERGYVGIANEIWDEIIRRDFTKRQKDILQFVLRLSYGCNRKIATIPKQKYFEICGVGEGHIKAEINYLIQSDVLILHKSEKGYQLNKNIEDWKVPSVGGWDPEKFNYLIHINIQEAGKEKQKLTESVSFHTEEQMEFYEENLTETVTFNEGEEAMKTYQNGNFNEDENLLKREVEENGELTETVTFENKNLPKREVRLTETVSFMSNEANQGAASESPKKGLKKKDIKKVLNKEIYVEIISYLNLKTSKKFSHETDSTTKFINGRISEGRTVEDFKHVIDIKTKEWLLDPKMNQYLCPSTLFNPTNFEKYLNQGGVINEKFKGHARSGSDQTNTEREIPEWQSLVLGSPEPEDV